MPQLPAAIQIRFSPPGELTLSHHLTARLGGWWDQKVHPNSPKLKPGPNVVIFERFWVGFSVLLGALPILWAIVMVTVMVIVDILQLWWKHWKLLSFVKVAITQTSNLSRTLTLAMPTWHGHWATYWLTKGSHIHMSRAAVNRPLVNPSDWFWLNQLKSVGRPPPISRTNGTLAMLGHLWMFYLTLHPSHTTLSAAIEQ